MFQTVQLRRCVVHHISIAHLVKPLHHHVIALSLADEVSVSQCPSAVGDRVYQCLLSIPAHWCGVSALLMPVQLTATHISLHCYTVMPALALHIMPWYNYSHITSLEPVVPSVLSPYIQILITFAFLQNHHTKSYSRLCKAPTALAGAGVFSRDLTKCSTTALNAN